MARLTSVFILLILSCFSASAQQCNVGPKCKTANSRAEQYLANYPSRYKGPAVHVTSLKAFCLNMIGASVSQVCANEMRSNGQPQCAILASRQKAEHERVAAQAKSAASASASTENWRATCGW